MSKKRMIFNRHLCLIVLLSLFGASFCDDTPRQLLTAFQSGQSFSELAAVMHEVAKYCENRRHPKEKAKAELMAQDFMDLLDEYYDLYCKHLRARDVRSARNILARCAMP
ncbi:uncharacterized protein LOC141850937 isoform X1 [Brevipalpus obovatus]|uniref:uncharacterized protein LOC141850937 isoform X1 n=1 Tax=Brevipalpus obovatus TaxID=246614 RepID=UPI003D9EC09C